MLAAGRKIEAIKRYREATGADLAEAKRAVEAIEQGGSLPEGSIGDSADEPEILALLRQGRKIEAIRHYRETNRSDLKTAKEAVEALAARHGIAIPRTGCLGAVLAVLALLYVAWN